MVPRPFVVDTSKELDKLPEDERFKFYLEVDNCMANSDWLRENRLDPCNPNRDKVIMKLYNQLYLQ